MQVFIAGISHHTAPVEIREKYAFTQKGLPEAMRLIKAECGLQEVVILSTCNRVEIYMTCDSSSTELEPRVRRFLAGYHRSGEDLGNKLYFYPEPRSLEHLFKVACGLDSMVLGETEILGQLKAAYRTALSAKQTGALLNKSFQKAFNVAKQIRSETNIQRGSISVGSVAVELAEKIFSSLGERKVMVIGAGDTSEKTARSLLSRGVHSVIVSNRSFEKAMALARDLDGQAIPFDQWEETFSAVDIVISSTAAPHYVLDRRKLGPLMKDRKNRELLLIDIAVPRDIEPEVNFLQNVFLFNIDDLQAIAADYLEQRRCEISRCEGIIVATVRDVMERRRRPVGGARGLAFESD